MQRLRQYNEKVGENAELKRENSALKEENAELKRENSALKEENAELKRENSALKTQKQLPEVIDLSQDQQQQQRPPAAASAVPPPVAQFVPLPENTFRVITGLVSAQVYNGRRCWIHKWLARRGRYQVVVGGTLDDPKYLNVKPQNLRKAVDEDFVAPPADIFDNFVYGREETPVIAFPDMLMFQPFALAAHSPTLLWSPSMMMNRNVWMKQYGGRDGGMDAVLTSALHLIKKGYPDPKYYQFVQQAFAGSV
eukprot:SAG11_NODE_3441_length_2445_cov_18.767263_2_plen_252_part_00